ncbi:hypothetical protein TYRP_019071 [Tyrophagus putrescentiae]|nr:hypothetical protein TYRP_019071 [Tyrophagus putrescentiae]
MTMTTAMKEKEKKKNTKTLFNVPPSEQHHAARSLAPKSNVVCPYCFDASSATAYFVTLLIVLG